MNGDDLDAAVAEFLAAEDAGQPLSLGELGARYPHLSHELTKFVEQHHALNSLLAPAPARVSLGASFAGFEVLAEAGFGGAAVVYRAHQADPAREVALKVLHPAGRGPRRRPVASAWKPTPRDGSPTRMSPGSSLRAPGKGGTTS